MKLLPLFPLQLVVFPNEIVKLHIFEPRYKKLIRDCEREDINFGIVPNINGKTMLAGTELELLSIFNLKIDGSCDIELKGTTVFHVVEFLYPEDLNSYLKGKIDYLDIIHNATLHFQTLLLAKLKQLFELLNVRKNLPDAPETLKSFDYAHYIGLSIQQELELLQIPAENERLKYLVRHLDTLIPYVMEINNLKEKIKWNGHIKYLKPPLF
jgi:Lon protease-like protein